MWQFIRNLFYEQYFLSVPDPTASFAHKTVIVTGSNTGLGKEAARHISQLGCTRLILAVRNVKSGEEARKDILASIEAPDSSIEVWAVDLGSFDSVRKFTDRVTKELDRLDVLICNAGINTFEYREAEGHESMLTTNVLSTYLMATRLLPLLERTAQQGPVTGDTNPRPPHLCIVSSDTHMMASFPERNDSPADLLTSITANCKTSGGRLRTQYATSKLLDLFLVRDLVYRQKGSGPSTGTHAVSDPEKKYPVIINAPNPGLCYSNLTREVATPARIINFVLRARPTSMGGASLVNAAAAGWESNGQFLSSNRVHQGSALSWDFAVAENLRKAIDGLLEVHQ